ncbi:hypothetical protein [Pseudoflavonifractor sp. 60]|uniref:stalk domain-containing protein n=1 Tax=Pseudoflavonifractor sp. 60 TaxID=2304576 RepID=UPI001370007E|nr:hypothetical protein [Pseudoflavonifractor sp. 60]
MKLYRKLTALCLSAALAAGMAITASADVSPVRVVVNGETASNSAYINSDWRTMVPVETAEAMGIAYTVEGDSVTFTANGISQTYTAGSAAGDTVATLVDGTLYVPFYHLAQTFGFQASWDSAAKAASATGSVAEETPDVPSAVTASINLNEYLLENTEKTNETTRALPIDRTEVNEHPVPGYLSYTLASDRTIKLYVGEHAALRAYITVIAIPNGVSDTYAFLEEQGWIKQAETYGELLFVLEPANGTWGTPAEEAAYLNDCLAETIGNTAFDTRTSSGGGLVQTGRFALSDGTVCPVFTGHSCNYYVGYGEGCAVLESWTANNPTYVIGQAFVGGTSVGDSVLKTASARTYNGINTGSYYPGLDDAAFSTVLEKMAQDGAAESASFITNADIPVPTLFVGYQDGDASVEYWKDVNDTVDTAVGGVYHQRLDSDAWQTKYANSNAKSWGAQYGISQVKLVDGSAMSASDIRSFLAGYTRYTNPFAYSNALGIRTDYYMATKAARTAAESGTAISSFTFEGQSGEQKTVELRALESVRLNNPGGSKTSGTVYSCIAAFNDYDGNGVLDPRETVMYIPDSAKTYGGDGAPVVVVFPGNTQAAATFMDCSMWWAIANDEGCVVIIMGEYCKTSAAGLTYGDTADSADFSRAALLLMENVVSKQDGVQVDMSRVYGSGHSLGCRTVQTLTHTSEAGDYAAVGSTSFPNTDFTADDIMPSYLLIGQADISEPDRNNDLVKDPWTVSDDSAIYNWVVNAQKMNGIDAPFTANDHDSFLEACSEYSETGRYYTYTWNGENDIPLVQFTRTLAREHNCYPEEFRLAWDFLEHYRLDEDGTRYYSASAFAQDDAVKIS